MPFLFVYWLSFVILTCQQSTRLSPLLSKSTFFKNDNTYTDSRKFCLWDTPFL